MIIIEDKQCLFCGKTLEKKDYETSRDFKRRRYCDAKCFNNHRLFKRKEKLLGQVFGLMKVINFVDKEDGLYVICECQCEKKTIKEYKYSGLKANKKNFLHCGCHNANITHGMSKTSLYKSWQAMKRRCDNPDNLHEKYYKNKGITYCEEWKKFENFRDWALENGWSEGLTIERKDNSKGYNPDNCCWATMSEQARNKTSIHYITIDGETKNITDWCKEYGIKWTTFYTRLKRGVTGKNLLKK